MDHERKRWFHHSLSGIQAEKLLLEKGVSGSFLARPSDSTPGSFTLSVRRDTSVTHIRIQNTGDFLDLYGGEKFATLLELVAYYMENQGQLKEKNGALIELKYPLHSEDPCTERWFHGRITGKEAEELLLTKGKYGSFLVRESVHKPGSYVLSVLTGDQVSHILIHRKPEGKFDVGGGHQFSTLKDLIELYSTTPMVEKSGGLICLKQPFNVTRLNVSTIDKRVRQLEKENGRGNGLAGFLEEFEELHQDTQTQQNTRTQGSQSFNRDKNRYKNILPFDNYQVVLRDGDPDEPSSNYINANYIHWPLSLTESLSGRRNSFEYNVGSGRAVDSGVGAPPASHMPDCYSYSSSQRVINNSTQNKKFLHSMLAEDMFYHEKPRYIATQGTLSNTLTDFWRMVWQERSAVIVMITKEVERGRNKCVRYWPTKDEGTLHMPNYGGALHVTLLSETPFSTYTLRELRLTREPTSTEKDSSKMGVVNHKEPCLPCSDSDTASENSFTVYQYHFLVWPDHGTPNDPSCVLNFMLDISARQNAIPHAGPMVVHCSAGIGRTGTFIVIDMLINYIMYTGLGSDIDISRTIQAVREQRSGMVQTETQYRFIYRAVQHYVSAFLRYIQVHNELQHSGVDYMNIKQALDDLGTSVGNTVTVVHSEEAAYLPTSQASFHQQQPCTGPRGSPEAAELHPSLTPVNTLPHRAARNA